MIEEIPVTIPNSMLLTVVRARFLHSNLTPEILESFYSELGEITEQDEDSDEVRLAIFSMVGRIVLSEVITKAVQDAVEAGEPGESIIPDQG